MSRLIIIYNNFFFRIFPLSFVSIPIQLALFAALGKLAVCLLENVKCVTIISAHPTALTKLSSRQNCFSKSSGTKRLAISAARHAALSGNVLSQVESFCRMKQDTCHVHVHTHTHTQAYIPIPAQLACVLLRIQRG